jgi:hypothetical protein
MGYTGYTHYHIHQKTHHHHHLSIYMCVWHNNISTAISTFFITFFFLQNIEKTHVGREREREREREKENMYEYGIHIYTHIYTYIYTRIHMYIIRTPPPYDTIPTAISTTSQQIEKKRACIIWSEERERMQTTHTHTQEKLKTRLLTVSLKSKKYINVQEASFYILLL